MISAKKILNSYAKKCNWKNWKEFRKRYDSVVSPIGGSGVSQVHMCILMEKIAKEAEVLQEGAKE